MPKTLVTGIHGVEDPTKAGLVFVVAKGAKGAKEAGHEVAIALVGDGVIVMKSAVRDSIVPVGLPPLKELFAFAVGNKIPVYV
jgi:predicted peroxiredoxin